MLSKNTVAEYLKPGQFIYLNNGTKKVKLLGVIPVTRKNQVMYKILEAYYGEQMTATKTFKLEEVDTGRIRVVMLDPDRYITSYTAEQF